MFHSTEDEIGSERKVRWKQFVHICPSSTLLLLLFYVDLKARQVHQKKGPNLCGKTTRR